MASAASAAEAALLQIISGQRTSTRTEEHEKSTPGGEACPCYAVSGCRYVSYAKQGKERTGEDLRKHFHEVHSQGQLSDHVLNACLERALVRCEQCSSLVRLADNYSGALAFDGVSFKRSRHFEPDHFVLTAGRSRRGWCTGGRLGLRS